MQLVKYAELCWASYSEGLNEGMFGDEERKFGNTNSEIFKERANNNKDNPTYHRALTESKYLIFEKYNVSFSNSQADHFIKRFEVLAFHQDNTEFSTLFNDTGFSATLFGEKRKQTNTESKEKSSTNDYDYTNYLLSIRGTESKLNFKHKIT